MITRRPCTWADLVLSSLFIYIFSLLAVDTQKTLDLDGATYTVELEKVSYFDACQKCISKSAELATIESEVLFTELKEKILPARTVSSFEDFNCSAQPSPYEFWVGLNKFGVDWRKRDRTEAAWTKWADTNEPRNSAYVTLLSVCGIRENYELVSEELNEQRKAGYICKQDEHTKNVDKLRMPCNPQDGLLVDGSLYLIFRNKSTLKEACAACKDMKAALAKIDQPSILLELKSAGSLIHHSKLTAEQLKCASSSNIQVRHWIGLVSANNDSQWEWQDGTPLEWGEWRDDSPPGLDQRGVYLDGCGHGYKFAPSLAKSYNNESLYGYICRKDESAPSGHKCDFPYIGPPTTVPPRNDTGDTNPIFLAAAGGVVFAFAVSLGALVFLMVKRGAELDEDDFEMDDDFMLDDDDDMYNNMDGSMEGDDDHWQHLQPASAAKEHQGSDQPKKISFQT